jgi:hypothetical protein
MRFLILCFTEDAVKIAFFGELMQELASNLMLEIPLM